MSSLTVVSGIAIALLLFFWRQALLLVFVLSIAFSMVQCDNVTPQDGSTTSPSQSESDENKNDTFSAKQYFKDCIEVTEKPELCAEVAAQLKPDTDADTEDK